MLYTAWVADSDYRQHLILDAYFLSEIFNEEMIIPDGKIEYEEFINADGYLTEWGNGWITAYETWGWEREGLNTKIEGDQLNIDFDYTDLIEGEADVKSTFKSVWSKNEESYLGYSLETAQIETDGTIIYSYKHGSKSENAGTANKDSENIQTGFWGVWIFASKNENESQKVADKLKNQGYDAVVVRSSDWENLNKEPYYCVTAGCYETKFEAENVLNKIKADGYVDAYIKVTGIKVE